MIRAAPHTVCTVRSATFNNLATGLHTAYLGLIDLIFNVLDRSGVRPQSVRLEQRDVALIQCHRRRLIIVIVIVLFVGRLTSSCVSHRSAAGVPSASTRYWYDHELALRPSLFGTIAPWALSRARDELLSANWQ